MRDGLLINRFEATRGRALQAEHYAADNQVIHCREAVTEVQELD